MSQSSEYDYLNQVISFKIQNDYGTVILDTEFWKQPETDNDIVRITSFIANVMMSALLKSQENGKNHFDVICYLNKFKITNINYKFVKYLTDILKQLFPDKLRSVLIIDPPKFFITAYDIIKRFIDKPTRKKISFISSNGIEVFNDDINE